MLHCYKPAAKSSGVQLHSKFNVMFRVDGIAVIVQISFYDIIMSYLLITAMTPFLFLLVSVLGVFGATEIQADSI